MRRLLLLAIVSALSLPSAAFAGTAGLGHQSTGNRYDPSRSALVFTAAPGERNLILVLRRGGDGVGSVLLRDDGAPVLAGPGCTAVDRHSVSCPVSPVTIDAGDGDDTLTVASEPRSAFDATVMRGGEGDDILSGRGSLAGGPGRDVLTGSPDDDVLLGGTGDDVLRGGAGDDRLVGDGDGDLKAAPDPGGGDDVIDGGAGRDHVLYIGRRAGVRVDLAARTASGGRGERDRLTRIEDVTGGRGADHLRGDAGPNRLDGHPGDDRLDGRAGNDELAAGRGTDTLRGGDGNDTLISRERADRLFGGAGDDTLHASYEPANLLSCGGGFDIVDRSPLGQVLDGCERVDLLGVTLSARPQRRARGALRFAWTCSTQAADEDNTCTMTMTLRLRSSTIARRTVSLPHLARGSFVLRARRPIRRGDRLDVTVAGGLGTSTRILLPFAARWRVRL